MLIFPRRGTYIYICCINRSTEVKYTYVSFLEFCLRRCKYSKTKLLVWSHVLNSILPHSRPIIGPISALRESSNLTLVRDIERKNFFDIRYDWTLWVGGCNPKSPATTVSHPRRMCVFFGFVASQKMSLKKKRRCHWKKLPHQCYWQHNYSTPPMELPCRAPRNRYHGPMRLHVTALLVVPTWSMWGPVTCRVGAPSANSKSWSTRVGLGLVKWLGVFVHRKKLEKKNLTIELKPLWFQHVSTLPPFLSAISLRAYISSFKASWRNNILEEKSVLDQSTSCKRTSTLLQGNNSAIMAFSKAWKRAICREMCPRVFVTISWAG